MELTELSLSEQRLMLELYCHEMDSSGQEISTDELVAKLRVEASDLKFAFRRLALKGLLIGHSLTVRGKLFVEEMGILPADRWSEVQGIREAISVCVVEAMVEGGDSEAIGIEQLNCRLPVNAGLLEFNLDVMAERGFLTVLRGNRVGLGPRLRALVGR